MSVPESAAGTAGQCPACGMVGRVPLPTWSAQPVEQTPESFFAALQTESTNTAPQHDRTPQYESNEYVARRKVQTIQQTGKFWKSLQALGVLGILGAVTWGMIAQDANTTAMCILVSVPSFVLYVVGRVGAWWFHG